ncbi:MAG: peptidoglycan D,D-transpeptidase FtsI family protein [Lachnospiraceae bacterium]
MKKNKKMAQFMQGKLFIVFLVIIAIFLVLAGRLIFWNVNKGEEFERIVLGQQGHSSTIIPYERGKIYDCNGKILVSNEKVYHLILEPKNMLKTEKDDTGKTKYAQSLTITLNALSKYLELDKDAILKTLESNKDSYYVQYKRNLSYDQANALKEYMNKGKTKITDDMSEKEKNEIKEASKITGVYFEEEYRRVYPHKTLACRILGFTVGGNSGNWGLEQQYNDTLNGVDGRQYSYLNEELTLETSVENPTDGNSIVSTINYNVQKIIEEELEKYDSKIGSKNTSILVMNPNNGEILGMASSYPYDLNKPRDTGALLGKYTEAQIRKFEQNQTYEDNGVEVKRESDDEIVTTLDALTALWRNPILNDTFEPGSTAKPFTVAMGLEESAYKGNEYFLCPGYMQVEDRKINCAHTHGTIAFNKVVSESCNVALMQIGLKLGKQKFCDYQAAFNFGKKTGIDLPGEADTSKLIYTEERMGSVDLATNSFGQNFNVTMLQLGAAFSSLINGGYYYEPHMVKQVIDANGGVIENIDKKLVKETVSAGVSETMKNYMHDTVVNGTAKSAAVEGYTVGGKTGTAEKLPRDKKRYITSFIGFAPVENPQLVVYVVIDEPKLADQTTGTIHSVQIEQACMERILKELNVPKSETEQKQQSTN